jgi:gp6-like head-tail connector protein
MTVSYTILTPVQAEPISLSDAKKWLRVDFDEDDQTIAELIIDARRYAENILQRSLAPQTLRAIIKPDAIAEGNLSGPVDHPTDPWVLAERVTAIPYGFYGPSFPLPMPPVTAISVVEYQLTPFDDDGGGSSTIWKTLDPTNSNGNANWRLDTEMDPSVVYLRTPLAATRFRITYTSGYAALPFDIRRNILSLIGFWYLNREGQNVPAEIDMKFARKRVFTL